MPVKNPKTDERTAAVQAGRHSDEERLLLRLMQGSVASTAGTVEVDNDSEYHLYVPIVQAFLTLNPKPSTP